jgi:shikimate kinase
VIGTACTHAAVTIVNALPTGVGCALGIDLSVRARVAVRRTALGREPKLDFTRGSGTPVVRESVRLALDAFATGGPWSASVELDSDIPAGRGLKSSSAVATAVAQATAHAFGRDPPPLEIARIAAGAGRTSGVSATGALDDALAGISPGFWLADCRGGTVLKRGPSGADWKVALYVPRAKHAPSPTWQAAFELRRDAGEAVVDQARAGNWWTAMRRNSELVEETMHYDYSGLRAGLIEAGALGAGVTGMGPALAAVAPADLAPRVLDRLPLTGGFRQLVAVTHAPERTRGGRS